jgi:hypothetical protein
VIATRWSIFHLLLALLVMALPLAAAAQEPQLQNDGNDRYPGVSGVLSDTVVHTRPQLKVPFTDSPALTQQEEEDLKAHPELTPMSAGDDNENTNPTAWWAYYGITPSELSTNITNLNARIIDIAIASASPLTFNAVLVSNSGSYGKEWWWYYGQSVAQISAELTANSARLISLKAYQSGGNTVFAAVMIRNSGADGKGWYWWVGQSISSLENALSSTNARLIAVDPYVVNGNTYYSAIAIVNSGADNKAWWWYINDSASSLASQISANNARITYINSAGNGKFNAIMESCSGGCPDWWYYYGASGDQLVATAVQNGARLLNYSSYPGCGGSCFTGAMINNSNAITTRVGNLIRNGGIGGTEGLYLKQVNGSVLANLEDNVVYEPASSIKVLINLYAMTQVQKGVIKLSTQVPHYTNGPDSCPNPPIVNGTESLAVALREMMYHSDNARTHELTDYFTEAKIDAYAKSIGLNNTSINQIIGCAEPPDDFTLDNAGTLYQGVATETFLNARDRGIFYSNMAGRAQYESEGHDWTGLWSTDIPNIINQVAPAGTTAAQKAAYQNEMNLAYKAGNYVLCTNNACTDVNEDIAITGWFQVPICSASGTHYNEFVFGVFFSNEPDSGWYSGKVTTTDANFTAAKGELLREQIQAGMASCNGRSFDVMAYTPSDLVFSTTKVGTTSAAKTITVKNNQLTKVAAISITDFGDFTQTNNCGTSLAAGKSCTITVKFTPTAAGERTGAVIIDDGGVGSPQSVQLTGTGQ